MKVLLSILGLLLTASAVAGDYQRIVRNAFEAIHQNFDEDWSFTESATTDDGVTVGRYDVLSPAGERWTLVSFDGRLPTDDEIDDFLDDKEKGETRKRRRNKSRDDASDKETGDDTQDNKREISALVNFETLELLEETADYWLFSFIPEDVDGDDFMRHVDGQVKVIKNGHYVEIIDLRNEKPIKPATGVKISKFETTMTFGPATDGGPIVPIAVDTRVNGRAMLVFKFDETDTIRYSDFEYAAREEEMVPDR